MPKDPEQEAPESDSIPDEDPADEQEASEEEAHEEDAESEPRPVKASQTARDAKLRARKAASEPPQEASRPSRRKRRVKSKKSLPRTEQEIDSPKPLTLLLLGAMSLSTLIMWGSARLACNEHGEVLREPPKLSTAELARTPKDAAIEMQQRAATFNFKGALELSKGSAADQLAKAKQQACGSDEECARKQEELGDAVLTTGALLNQDSASATVRVSTKAPSGSSSYLLRLEPEGNVWKVTERRPDTASKN